MCLIKEKNNNHGHVFKFLTLIGLLSALAGHLGVSCQGQFPHNRPWMSKNMINRFSLWVLVFPFPASLLYASEQRMALKRGTGKMKNGNKGENWK